MKTLWKGGSTLKQITAVIAPVIFMLTIFFTANIAEAGANVNFNFVSVTTEPGKAKVNVYFYNNGNAGARVKKFTLTGNIAGRNINVTYSGSNISVGYVAPGDKRHWTFSITDNYFRYHDSNPKWNLHGEVTFGN